MCFNNIEVVHIDGLVRSGLISKLNDDDLNPVNNISQFGTAQLINEQRSDSELMPMLTSALTERESVGVAVCYYLRSGLLMRKWRPPHVRANDE